MRGEQRAATIAFMQMFNRGPRDRKSVESRGAASDLVENHKCPFAGLIEDGSGFYHLDHEGGSSAREVICCAHAREQPIHDADMCELCRYITSDLRQQRDQRVLAQEGRFAGHVWSGDEPNLS